MDNMDNMDTINYLIAILLLEGRLRFVSIQLGLEGIIGVWLISSEEVEKEDSIKLPKKDLENIIDLLSGYLKSGNKK